MTKGALTKIVEGWQARLGLDGWDIRVDWGTVTPDGDFAEVVKAESYDTATVTWASAWSSWDERLANQVVAHELVHLCLRDFERVIEDARSGLHPSASDQVKRRFDHELEGVVDRLALRFVELGGCV